MKKFLTIFFIGQLLLLSYIFTTSVYDIYELNNLGNKSLNGYILKDSNGDKLNKLYDSLNNYYIMTDKYEIQLIKTPISENNKFIYDIYNSNYKSLNKYKPISDDTVFDYYELKKDDFIDSTGVFYTNIKYAELNKIAKDLNLIISEYDCDKIKYSQIIKFNSINFIILVILTLLILLIYTILRIKTNAIKKMLGYSKIKMFCSQINEFFKIELFASLLVLLIHLIFYSIKGIFLLRYYKLLVLFFIVIILINSILLMIPQITIRFIDINSMIKNRIYSNGLNNCLHFIKIILIISTTISISLFLNNYNDYTGKSKDLDKYKKLAYFYTSNGFNSNEYDKAMNDKKILSKYGSSVKELYDLYDNKENLYVKDSDIIELLSENHLKLSGQSKEDILNSMEINNLTLNPRYIENSMELKDENGSILKNLNADKPLVLVPKKYKEQEKKVKEIYIDKYNNLMNYNKFYDIDSKDKNNINDISIIYLQNNQTYELIGTQENNSDLSLKDSIIIVDQGNFDDLYYYDLLNKGNISFKLNDREEFSQLLRNYDLQKLINVGTLLTPYMTRMHNIEFIVYNSLIFTMLFSLTLLFILYISNYIDIITNRKKYSIQYILGYGDIRILKDNIFISVILMLMTIIKIFVNINIAIYLVSIVLDFILLVYFFNKIIKKDLYKVEKGG